MAVDLTLESLEGMSKSEYIKAFKNKTVWKKAKAVIFMVDYKLEGKKTVIALPFKKESEMKLKMREMKKNKTHLLKKTGGGFINVENDGPEGLMAFVELSYGGLKPEILQEKALELFGRINATLKVVVSENAETDDETENESSDYSSNESEEFELTDTDNTEEKNSEIKSAIEKIYKLTKKINLKDGLQSSDESYAQMLKAEIRSLAQLLKTADSDTRQEFGEAFIKSKKIYAKLEEELKKLKEKQTKFNSKLDDELDDVLNEDDEYSEIGDSSSDDDIPESKKEAIERNKELIEEINDLLKSVDVFSMN